jgi:acyl carrier protein
LETLSTEEVEREVTAIVAEVTELDREEIWKKRDANFFKELEIDSLLALEILALIEKKFKIQIPEEKLVDITSLTGTINMTKSVLAGNGRLKESAMGGQKA